MGLPCEAALRFLRRCFIFLCKLLLVDVVCAYVSGWLVYFYLKHKMLVAPPNLNDKRSEGDTGLQVIICGYPRCGCTSLWQAMDILGFPCFHGAHLAKPSTAMLLMKARASGARQDWEKLLHGYKSIIDAPATFSYKQLMEMYPNAKVILNFRDPIRWYKSISQTILKYKSSLVFEVVQPYLTRDALIRPNLTKEQYISQYLQHVEEVKRHVPPHKLYVLDIEMNRGWAPLCEFLEVPIPNIPFPFLNKRDDMNKLLQTLGAIDAIVLVSYLFLVFNLLFVCSWKWLM